MNSIARIVLSCVVLCATGSLRAGPKTASCIDVQETDQDELQLVEAMRIDGARAVFVSSGDLFEPGGDVAVALIEDDRGAYFVRTIGCQKCDRPLASHWPEYFDNAKFAQRRIDAAVAERITALMTAMLARIDLGCPESLDKDDGQFIIRADGYSATFGNESIQRSVWAPRSSPYVEGELLMRALHREASNLETSTAIPTPPIQRLVDRFEQELKGMTENSDGRD